MDSYYIGVDVGTSSVRVALSDQEGKIVRTAEKNISIHTPYPDHYEQSSDEIWQTCCELIKDVTADFSKESVKGIGFDATCSLVVLDDTFQPVNVGQEIKKTKYCYDVIMWMDHRAGMQADIINSKNHEVLKYVGGKISLEMQPPKILWLKQMNRPSWERAAHFFDLPDFLTFRATGSCNRSLCSLRCKWGYTPQNGWMKDFWSEIGLHDLTENNFVKIGNKVNLPGTPIGNGLCKQAALAMNLNVETAVGTSLIDAHCGGVGCIASDLGSHGFPNVDIPLTERLTLICGTSSCHMALSKEPLFVKGVWGPYLSAMLPNLWLNEAGQSASGKLIDHLIDTHPAFPELQSLASSRNKHRHVCLNDVLQSSAKTVGLKSLDFLTANLHIWPDFHGNRSPVADPTLCGAVCGLTLDVSLDNLAKMYLAAIQALANGTRHILDEMAKKGQSVKAIFMCGGLSKNPLFVKIHANVLGMPIILSKESETVLLGACILGAFATGTFESLEDAMKSMSKCGEVVQPDQASSDYYNKKYKVFRAMLAHQVEYRRLMACTNP